MDGAAFRIAGISFLNPEPELLLDSLGALAANHHYRSMRNRFVELKAALREPDLQPEHARLFGTDPVCPPWQHAACPAGHSELIREDHVGLQLISFSQLLERNAPPLDLLQFWTDHLEWVPEFCLEFERHARHEYFRLLGAWMREELLKPGIETSHPQPVLAQI